MVNVSTHTPAPGYTYYNNVNTATLLPIFYTHTLNITLKNVDMESMLKVWIDYNANNIFETGEVVMSVPQGSVGMGMAVVKTETFQVPGSAPWFTNTRMRVSLGWHYANWSSSTFSLDACHTPIAGDGSAGETEDYNVYNYAHEGLNELSSAFMPQLFPNPSHSEVNVPQSIVQITTNYELIDRLGRRLITADKFPINVRELQSDLYYIRFYLKSGQILNSKLQVD